MAAVASICNASPFLPATSTLAVSRHSSGSRLHNHSLAAPGSGGTNSPLTEYLRNWLGEPPKEGEPPPPAGLTAKTCERYRELAEGQIIPHKLLQKLRPIRH
jgi:hypothetical protein